MSENAKMSGEEKAKAWFGLFIFIAFLASCSALSSNDPAKDPANVQYDAKGACENFVKNKLKAPATADFGGADEVVVEDLTNPANQPAFTITGVVDAQNGFGANVRSTWTCSIHTEGTKWIGTTELSS